jgi:hypothetical protein
MPKYSDSHIRPLKPEPDSRESHSRDGHVFSDDINDWIYSPKRKSYVLKIEKRKYIRKQKKDERLN